MFLFYIQCFFSILYRRLSFYAKFWLKMLPEFEFIVAAIVALILLYRHLKHKQLEFYEYILKFEGKYIYIYI